MEEIYNIIEEQKEMLKHLNRVAQSFDNNALKTRGFAQGIMDEIDMSSQQFKGTHLQLCNIARDNSINTNDIPYFSEDVFYQFQDVFLSLKGRVLDFISEGNITPSPHFHSTYSGPSHSRNETVSAGARLPKIDLPTFSGDYLSWISYKDLFETLVHTNPALDNVQRFWFLKGSCSGTPLDIINEYPTSAANYQLAWSDLNSRFQNKRKIVDTLLKKLFSIPQSDGTAQSIQNLLDSTRNSLALLRTLDITTENWDPVIVYMTVNKLDVQIRKEWEQSLKASTEIPPIKDLYNFLEMTFRTLETISEATPKNYNMFVSNSESHRNYRQNPRRSINVSTNNDVNCLCCNKRHLLFKCFKFAALSSASKRDFLNSNRICRNCLNAGHLSYDCPLTSRCQTCHRNHHTILHNEYAVPTATDDDSQYQTSANTGQTAQSSLSATVNVVANVNKRNLSQILLATLRVIVRTDHGDYNLRAILDQCAQATLITHKAADVLKLSKYKTYAQICGVGAENSYVSKNYVKITLSSNYNKNFEINCRAFVLPKITSYKPLPMDKRYLPNFSGFDLADPHFLESDEIDILLGGDLYGDLILPGQKKFTNSLFLQLTPFGYIVSGPTTNISYSQNIHVNISSLDEQLSAFWNQEELIEERQATQEEDLCEIHFKKTVHRDQSGRYTVSLPFKSLINNEPLPSFYHTDYSALSRLKNLENKFRVNPQFAKLYKDFMTEYEELGHMKWVGNYPHDLCCSGYFLPHHGVLRDSSSTTKLRVVFDGSSKRQSQTSLNDQLASGPALQNDLPTIINRWRRFKVGFRSDLEKMFRQIRVVEDHLKFQQVLWKRDSSDEISIYQLSTVTYGTTCAPFLSIRVLQQLASDEYEYFPLACEILKTDTYVDDVISGADSVGEAVNLYYQLTNLLRRGQFNLRKWTTNADGLLSVIPKEFREIRDTFELHDTNTVKALGLEWNTKSDCFSFKINFGNDTIVTKRSLISDAARLYDPLGWLAPTTICAKIEFQNLWLLGLDWNDVLPEELRVKWLDYRRNLKELERIRIPRWIGTTKQTKIEVHGFCDSSKLAYAAAVYVKTIDNDGFINVHLLQSKTKVAPLKRLTIPRLELSGANLLVRLVHKIETSLVNEIADTYYWTDSTTVLSWIRGQSSRWPVFVGNRVADIQRMSNTSQWKYVSTKDNPADCASRGISAEELVHHDLWWNGPQWLKNSKHNWPKQPDICHEHTDQLNLLSVSTLTSNIKEREYPELLSRFSSLSKLKRVTAFMFRFKNNCLSKIRSQSVGYGKMTDFLTTGELQGALEKLVKISQAVEFSAEIHELEKYGQITTNKHISNLCPLLDSFKILRVGGRIQESNLNYCSKHPILLKKQNPLSFLLFVEAHSKTLHGGLLQMMSYVSREFWILSGRNIAKKVLRQCSTCFKYNAKAAQYIMGNLPSVRLKPARPFKHSGVDYAGPITIKQSTARNTVTTKGYICLFICMVTKALHLEAVTNLSTEAFLAAFRRFVSRRGICTDIYSDCGTNFVGASKELQIFYSRSRDSLPEEINDLLASNGTTWHFIPPASPNFGGLWEAGVKSTKYHLKPIINNRILTYEELSTLLSEIECCLNSRPLCPLSSEPSDCNALTPSHFLIGEPSLCVPERDLLECNIDRLTRWKVVEKLKQHFWRRWVDEYLCRLQARPKWLKLSKNPGVGDLVLVFDERCPPGQWPLARIKEIHPGKDAITRVITLYSQGKLFKRPVSKIAFLPKTESVDKPDQSQETIEL